MTVIRSCVAGEDEQGDGTADGGDRRADAADQVELVPGRFEVGTGDRRLLGIHGVEGRQIVVQRDVAGASWSFVELDVSTCTSDTSSAIEPIGTIQHCRTIGYDCQHRVSPSDRHPAERMMSTR